MFGKKILSMVLLAGLLISQSVPRARAATYCDQVQFVSDLTAPDGSSFAPGAGFTKTWRLMNIGSCMWTTSYSLVWAGGDSLGAPAPVKLPVDVPPGQMVDISVNLTAPSAAGHYNGLFKLSNTANVQFGIGESASDPFWVDIHVVETSAVIYDFVANAPFAQWRSGAGFIPFPGTSGDNRGFGYRVNNPHLEDDSFDPAAGLLVVPQNKFNGYIQATYPEFQVQAGDRLQTLVNCEFGATNCYATFRIDYLLPNGAQRTLWSWKEAYDKRFYRADLDLSPLAGQRVRFVFMVLSTGFASGDRAIWGSPRITRTGPSQPPGPPPTLTPLPPLPATATPIGQPPPTVAPSGCDRAAFVTDATVPDGTTFAPGAAFTKTWRLRNVGSCIWSTSYKLVYYSGEAMSAPTSVNLPWNVPVNGTVDVSVNMIAPTAAGEYRGFWVLANANGQYFGIGSDASKPIWVEIKVAGAAPVNTGYDFTANVCSAEWRSTVGALPCPGANGASTGFVLKLDAPQMEDGSTGAPGLLTVPQNRYNGYIQGFYPTFTVLPGDKFEATIGCEYGAACYLTYRLDYMTPSGYIGTFWSWREQNEGRVYNASIDLSPLSGRSVRFILTILATGSATNDRAIWGSPRIVRAGGTATATATTTLTPSSTPPPADWLKYTNPMYEFEFRYPPHAQIVNQSNSSLRMNLPFTSGTNLREKYLEMIVRENVSPCQSPLAASSRPSSSETIVVNGISFLKETGGDGGAGNFYDWVAYSTIRNNACISMDFMLHSLNAGNFPTPPPLFDRTAESAVFGQMMETFAWMPVTLTPIPPTVTATHTPELVLPDLAIAQMRIELQNPGCLTPDDLMGVRLWVTNHGQAAAGSFAVDVNGVEQTVSGLAAGETKDLFFASYSNPVTAVIDPTSLAAESDENNNSRSEMLPVPTPPLPCVTPTVTETPIPVTPTETGPISHEAFCADPRIPVLIDQLRASMSQSNGDLFAGLVSPSRGVSVRLWAYSSEVSLGAVSARSVFSGTDSQNWGVGPSGIPDVGSFRDIIQPKLLEVLNAPSMETYCDELTKVFPLSNPWPYPNVRYYNLYKPATPGIDFDFRTWLIGFEYINDQPYLHSLVTIVWEP